MVGCAAVRCCRYAVLGVEEVATEVEQVRWQGLAKPLGLMLAAAQLRTSD